MLFRRVPAPEPSPEQLPADASTRRQGSVEALNLVATSLLEAAESARGEVDPGDTDNFIAGQMMAFGLVLQIIEREREALQQQLIREAGVADEPERPDWGAEMALLASLRLTSEDLFRLAMDFRQVDQPSEEITLVVASAGVSIASPPEPAGLAAAAFMRDSIGQETTRGPEADAQLPSTAPTATDE